MLLATRALRSGAGLGQVGQLVLPQSLRSHLCGRYGASCQGRVDMMKLFSSSADDEKEAATSASKRDAKLQDVWATLRSSSEPKNVLQAFAGANGLSNNELNKFVSAAENSWDVQEECSDARIAAIEQEMLEKYTELAAKDGQQISILDRASRHASRSLWLGATGVLAQGLGVWYITYAPELKEKFDIDIMVDWFGSFDPWDNGWDQWGWDFAEPVTYFLAFGTGLVGYIWFLTTRTEHEYDNMYTFIRNQKMRSLQKAEGYDPEHVQELKHHLWLLGKELQDLKGVEVKHATGRVPVRSDEIVEALSDVIDLSHAGRNVRLNSLLEEYKVAVKQDREMSELRDSLDSKAAKSANRKMHLGGLGMCTTFFLTAMGTWEWASWDLVEPITYFLGFSSVMFGSLWFSTTKTDFTYDAVRDRFRCDTLSKLYKRNVYDPAAHKRIEAVIRESRDEYEALYQRTHGQRGSIDDAVAMLERSTKSG